MDDQLRQLEQLARLREQGALTAAEFDAEKRRVLGHGQTSIPHRAEPPPSLGAVPDDDEATNKRNEIRRGARIGFTTSVCISAIAGIGRYLLAQQEQPPVTKEVQSTERPSAPAMIEPVKLPPKPPPNLEDSLSFATPSNCQASAATEKLFNTILTPPNGDIRNIVSNSIRVGADRIRIDPKFRKSEEDGYTLFESVADFPQPATWNGLKTLGVTASLYVVPESDSTYSRKVRFAEEPEALRVALNKLGFNVPQSPEYAELTDNACGGSMQVVPIAGGSALQCSWGC